VEIVLQLKLCSAWKYQVRLLGQEFKRPSFFFGVLCEDFYSSYSPFYPIYFGNSKQQLDEVVSKFIIVTSDGLYKKISHFNYR
jgi:hypothetical protein